MVEIRENNDQKGAAGARAGVSNFRKEQAMSKVLEDWNEMWWKGGEDDGGNRADAGGGEGQRSRAADIERGNPSNKRWRVGVCASH